MTHEVFLTERWQSRFRDWVFLVCLVREQIRRSRPTRSEGTGFCGYSLMPFSLAVEPVQENISNMIRLLLTPRQANKNSAHQSKWQSIPFPCLFPSGHHDHRIISASRADAAPRRVPNSPVYVPSGSRAVKNCIPDRGREPHPTSNLDSRKTVDTSSRDHESSFPCPVTVGVQPDRRWLDRLAIWTRPRSRQVVRVGLEKMDRRRRTLVLWYEG